MLAEAEKPLKSSNFHGWEPLIHLLKCQLNFGTLVAKFKTGFGTFHATVLCWSIVYQFWIPLLPALGFGTQKVSVSYLPRVILVGGLSNIIQNLNNFDDDVTLIGAFNQIVPHLWWYIEIGQNFSKKKPSWVRTYSSLFENELDFWPAPQSRVIAHQ